MLFSISIYTYFISFRLNNPLDIKTNTINIEIVFFSLLYDISATAKRRHKRVVCNSNGFYDGNDDL